jgi:hypothetical protein
LDPTATAATQIPPWRSQESHSCQGSRDHACPINQHSFTKVEQLLQNLQVNQQVHTRSTREHTNRYSTLPPELLAEVHRNEIRHAQARGPPSIFF